MTCIKCQHGIAKKFGTYGRLRIQRFRCKSCNATFTRQHPLGRHYIQNEKAAQIISLLTEGMSIRAVSRITGVHKTTILSLLVTPAMQAGITDHIWTVQELLEAA